MKKLVITIVFFLLITSAAFVYAANNKDKGLPNGQPFLHLQEQIDNLQDCCDPTSFFDVFVELEFFHTYQNNTEQRLSALENTIELMNSTIDSFFDVFVELDATDASLDARIDDLESRFELLAPITCCVDKEGCFSSTIDECRAGGGAVMECMPVPEAMSDPPLPGEGVNYTQTNSTGPQSEWLQNLTRDVNSTGIHNQSYVPSTHDCDDFAHELERNLTNMTYNATFTYYWCKRSDNTYFGHAVTDIRSPDGTMVWIEPQTGKVVNLDFDGDGTVEARNHHVNNRDAFTDDNCAIEVFEDQAAAVAAGVSMD